MNKNICMYTYSNTVPESPSPSTSEVFYPRSLGNYIYVWTPVSWNKKMVKDSHPLSLPAEVQDRLSEATIFSMLDLPSDHWQMPVNTSWTWYGAIWVQKNVFGLSDVPSFFQHVMNKVLWRLPFVIIYLDYILIHSVDEEMHRKHLTEMFQ